MVRAVRSLRIQCRLRDRSIRARLAFHALRAHHRTGPSLSSFLTTHDPICVSSLEFKRMDQNLPVLPANGCTRAEFHAGIAASVSAKGLQTLLICAFAFSLTLFSFAHRAIGANCFAQFTPYQLFLAS